MATPIKVEIEYTNWEIAMTINPEQKTEFRILFSISIVHRKVVVLMLMSRDLLG